MTEGADALLARLAHLETGQVSDVLDEAGITSHALSSALTPLAAGSRFAGRAVCMRGEAMVPGRHARPALPADALTRAMRPNGVLLVDTGGSADGAILGGFVAYDLQRAGCVGIVTDGFVRDADEIRSLGLPVVAAGVTPVNGARRWRWVDAEVSITLPGQGRPIMVAPGDYVLADGDGVVVVSADVAGQVIEDAEALAAIERRIGQELRDGGGRAEVFARNPRFAHVRAVASRNE